MVEDATPLNVVIAESVVIDVDTGTIVTFTPQDQLTEGVTYRATLKGGPDGVKDLALPGNEMLEDFVWTFTAVAPSEPCFEPFPLNAAEPFGIFGGSAGVTNQGLLDHHQWRYRHHGRLHTGDRLRLPSPDCAYTITTLNEGQVNGRIFTAPAAANRGVPAGWHAL
ncbi:MAG: Ig-like domain-containing protein [Gammaproteobacteria bacterium]|nr:Ig-like domain-containing protein [Gammaproteobacteria bacterium]